jgi:hypothetical protein
MATSTLVLDASPRDIWSVLADASAYSRWVAGMREVYEIEGLWPRPGSRFRCTVNWHGFIVPSTTTSLAAVAPRHMAFSTQRRRFGIARIDIHVNPRDQGTEVELSETVMSPAPFKAVQPTLEPSVRKRNLEALRRLGRLSETTVKGGPSRPRSSRRSYRR